jgi:hypothetical protein
VGQSQAAEKEQVTLEEPEEEITLEEPEEEITLEEPEEEIPLEKLTHTGEAIKSTGIQTTL